MPRGVHFAAEFQIYITVFRFVPDFNYDNWRYNDKIRKILWNIEN